MQHASLVDKLLHEFMFTSFMQYSEKVIFDRAIPLSQDGLKNVHRALLWSAFEETNGLKKNDWLKASMLVGRTTGYYHPHGPASAAGALVGMTEDHISLFEVGGTLSSKATASKTADRYPDIRFSPLGVEFMSAIHLAPMGLSHVDKPMPLAIPPRFPYQLMRSSTNIAVGFEGQELPWNPVEVIDATIALAEALQVGRELSTAELAEILLGPDLDKGHTLYLTKPSLHSLIEKGWGIVSAVCDVHIDGKEIIISEVPFKERSPDIFASLVKKSNFYHKNKGSYSRRDRRMVAGLKDAIPVRDVSNGRQIKLICNLDGSAPADFVLTEIFNKTNLKRSYLLKNVQIVEVDGQQKISLISVRQILEQSISVNAAFYRDKYTTELQDLERRFIVNRALEKITHPDHIDYALDTFKRKNKVALLLARPGLDMTEEEIQLALRQNINKLSERDQILLELQEFEGKKAELLRKLTPESLLNDTLHYLRYTIRPLVAPYARRSRIVYSRVSTKTPKLRTKAAPNETFVTIDGLQVSASDYASETPNCQAMSDQDYVVAYTSDKFHRIPVKELSETALNVLNYTAGERAFTVFPLRKAQEELVFFLHENGSLKSMSTWEADTRVAVVAAPPLEPGNLFSFTTPLNGYTDHVLALVTKLGFTKLVRLSRFVPKLRMAGFQRVTKLKAGDSIVWAQVLPAGFEQAHLQIDGKRFTIDEVNWLDRVENLGIRIPVEGDVTDVDVTFGLPPDSEPEPAPDAGEVTDAPDELDELDDLDEGLADTTAETE